MSFHRCENCGTGNHVGETVCSRCQFPLGENIDDTMKCDSCGDWFRREDLDSDLWCAECARTIRHDSARHDERMRRKFNPDPDDYYDRARDDRDCGC